LPLPDQVQRVIRELRERGLDSPYLERLRARVDPGAAMDELAVELMAERAAALGRAEAKIEVALLELQVIAHDLDAGAPSSRVADFNRVRQAAERARWELQVHREALGLRRNDILRELYPIPPRR
jgi:hypothetical protein